MRRLKLILILSLVTNSLLQSQDLEKTTKGFAFGSEASILSPYDGSINSIYDTDYEVGLNSFIWGTTFFTHYHFSHNVYVGLVFGYEYLNQPSLEYYPLMIGVGILTSTTKNGYLLEINLGTHLGNLDNNGFISRGKIGYSVGFLRSMALNFGLLYSFQNLNQTFTNSMRPENYYNLESLGVFINIKWNTYEK